MCPRKVSSGRALQTNTKAWAGLCLASPKDSTERTLQLERRQQGEEVGPELTCTSEAVTHSKAPKSTPILKQLWSEEVQQLKNKNKTTTSQTVSILDTC